MKNIITILTLLLGIFGYQAKAQYVFIPDQTGKPLTDAKYENVTGSPYLVEEWTNAEVKLADNNMIKPAEVRYDMVSDKLLFRQENKVYEFFPKVAAFTLFTKSGKRTFLLKNGINNDNGYYELLNNGKITLLKKVKKVVLEAKGYNSANVEKLIDESKKYYILNDGKEKEVKLNKNSLVSVLPNYKAQIDLYKGKLSNEKDFLELITSLN
ncbi:hypothetical protein [Pedobacter sp. Leaf132]|uniref:hypothetical protein n=1 Tax=Pedobacter sp. Leaf132 TaxID=2876557 RepID=UPI001E3C300A|nr:hypothetical protein [Pedobacter sp. Leaf132]